MSSKDKCWKGRLHNWEDYNETITHIIKQCTDCHGLKWIPRRTILTNKTVGQRVARV